MRVEAVKSNYNFSSANKPQQRKTDKNPISKTGEKTNLAVATFVGGLGSARGFCLNCLTTALCLRI